MNLQSIKKAYDRYSLWYDLLFGLFFAPGRKDALSNTQFESHSHILEVGIGTGASLPLYPRDILITGVDLSESMLKVCSSRASRHKLDNVSLYEMDAEQLSFSDSVFSHVAAMYIVSVSPNPSTLIDELSRVCASGGEILIVNHFSRNHGLITKIEKSKHSLA